MDDEMLSSIRSMTRSEGLPQLGGVHINVASGYVEHFTVEWLVGSKWCGIAFAAHEDHRGLGLPVMDYREAVAKLTIGSFPD